MWPGMRVMLHSLQKQTHMNESSGTLEEFSKGRWLVTLDASNSGIVKVRISEKNLKVHPSTSITETMQCAQNDLRSKRLAFCMGLHARLGEDSALNFMDLNLLDHILDNTFVSWPMTETQSNIVYLLQQFQKYLTVNIPDVKDLRMQILTFNDTKMAKESTRILFHAICQKFELDNGDKHPIMTVKGPDMNPVGKIVTCMYSPSVMNMLARKMDDIMQFSKAFETPDGESTAHKLAPIMDWKLEQDWKMFNLVMAYYYPRLC
jgi:hypothetical protein